MSRREWGKGVLKEYFWCDKYFKTPVSKAPRYQVIQGLPWFIVNWFSFFMSSYRCAIQWTHSQSLRHVQLFVTPWTAACQAPLSMGFFRQEYCSGLPFPTPGDLPDTGIQPMSLASPALADRFFTTKPVNQFSHSVMSNSLRPHGLQHARLPSPSPTPRAYSNSCPTSWWCHPTVSSFVISLLLLPSVFPSIRVFSNESVPCIRWPQYWSFSFSISPSNEY